MSFVELDPQLELNKLQREVDELVGFVIGTKPDYTDGPYSVHRWRSAAEKSAITIGGLRPREAHLQNREVALSDIVRPEVQALREKLAEKDEAAAGLRREAEALRKKAEAAQKALREKEQELEGAYRTFRNVVGMSATPQRAPESDKSQQDYRRPDTPITSPGRSYTGDRGGVPYPHWNPETRGDEVWEEHVRRTSGGDHHGEWDSD